MAKPSLPLFAAGRPHGKIAYRRVCRRPEAELAFEDEETVAGLLEVGPS